MRDGAEVIPCMNFIMHGSETSALNLGAELIQFEMRKSTVRSRPLKPRYFLSLKTARASEYLTPIFL